MQQAFNFNMLRGDTINGYGIQIHHTFTSFDYAEIEEIRRWCEKHIKAGLVLESESFMKESEVKPNE